MCGGGRTLDRGHRTCGCRLAAAPARRGTRDSAERTEAAECKVKCAAHTIDGVTERAADHVVHGRADIGRGLRRADDALCHATDQQAGQTAERLRASADQVGSQAKQAAAARYLLHFLRGDLLHFNYLMVRLPETPSGAGASRRSEHLGVSFGSI